jgi:hypothetical protein
MEGTVEPRAARVAVLSFFFVAHHSACSLEGLCLIQLKFRSERSHRIPHRLPPGRRTVNYFTLNTHL